MTRWLVMVTQVSFETDGSVSVETAQAGPFRARSRAERRAVTIRREAETYEDPEGVTGPENALTVTVEPLVPGSWGAERIVRLIYDRSEVDEE